MAVLPRLNGMRGIPSTEGRVNLAQAPVRVFAIDQHPLCRMGLAAILGGDGSCAWVGEAGSVAEALTLASSLRPEVALIEHRPPAINGIAAVAALQVPWPTTRFMIMTSRVDAGDAKRAMNAGASCLLQKTVTAAELMLAVHAVHKGQHFILPAIAAARDKSQRDEMSRNEMTPRELTLLELMAQGLDNRAISVAMQITVPTVKFHVTNVMSKMHAPNRTAAVLAALRLRIITLEPRASAQARN